MKLTNCSASLGNVALFIGLVLALGHVSVGAQNLPLLSGLKAGFYRGRCSNSSLDIQAFIEGEVATFFKNNPTILAQLLRLQFHDCFVNGCDASILIRGAATELAAGANIDIGGIDFIDALKAKVELKCPDIVSCADIIAIATKVVLKLGSGGAVNYIVETGRKDGTRSNAGDVILPGPSMSVSDAFTLFFRPKGFSLEEMVALLAFHTVGKTRCEFFENRLYPGNDEFDANMDESLRKRLKTLCPQGKASTNKALLDDGENSANLNKVDVSFLIQIAKRKGILPIDQALTGDERTNTTVNNFIKNPASLNTKLGEVMLKLQRLQGTAGNIRKVCSELNK